MMDERKAPEELVTCPLCEGRGGVYDFYSLYAESKRPNPEEDNGLTPCPFCLGAGKVTQPQAVQWEEVSAKGGL